MGKAAAKNQQHRRSSGATMTSTSGLSSRRQSPRLAFAHHIGGSPRRPPSPSQGVLSSECLVRPAFRLPVTSCDHMSRSIGSGIQTTTSGSSSTALHLAWPHKLRGLFEAGSPPSPTVTIVATLASLLVGYLVGRLTNKSKKPKMNPSRVTNAPEISRLQQEGMAMTNTTAGMSSPFGTMDEMDGSSDEQSPVVGDSVAMAEDYGATPLWLNYALARMWALFQKNTKRVMQETIQPILDETEKPPLVNHVKLTKFKPGRQSPFVRSLKRLPSRAMAEVQYSLSCKFSSSSVFEFQLEVDPFGKNTTFVQIPVTLRNLDVDCLCWTSFQLAPYEPFCTSVEYSLLEPPIVSFDMTISNWIPITAVPILRSFFFRVVTEEVPKEFLYPAKVRLDFTPNEIIAERITLASHGMEQLEDYEELTDKQLREEYPEQFALFDALDLDGNGSLTAAELMAGLKDWGYTAADATESFAKLDVNADNQITVAEFCHMWPKLMESFVPSRYKGTLTIFLRRAYDLAAPTLFNGALSDPYVQFRLGERVVSSKRDRQTSKRGEPGNPIWMETHELNCLDVSQEVLEVSVLEGRQWARGKVLGRAHYPLQKLRKRPRRFITIDLEKAQKAKDDSEESSPSPSDTGKLLLDLYYSDFVDANKKPYGKATLKKMQKKEVV